MFGAKVSEDKVSIMRSDSLGQKKRENKLELEEHGDEVDLEDVVDDDEEEEDQFSESLLSRTNLYVDSPRVGGRYDGDVSVEEIKRRKKIGMATVGGIGLSIMFCILFLKYLSNHEGFNILPPTQQRFMLATTTRGAKENLEQYTTVSWRCFFRSLLLLFLIPFVTRHLVILVLKEIKRWLNLFVPKRLTLELKSDM
jgi:hypothetical protein